VDRNLGWAVPRLVCLDVDSELIRDGLEMMIKGLVGRTALYYCIFASVVGELRHLERVVSMIHDFK
jgi:hypothetical protein